MEEVLDSDEPESAAVNLPSYQKTLDDKQKTEEEVNKELKATLKAALEAAKENYKPKEDKAKAEERPLVAKAKKVLGDNVNIDWEDVLYDDDDDDEDGDEDGVVEGKDEL